MRQRRLGALVLACTLAAASTFGTAIGPADASAKAACALASAPGRVLPAVPWAQQRLQFERAWSASIGDGVTVAVISSGVDTRQPQLTQPAAVAKGFDFVRNTPDADVDCFGLGTAAAGIIGARPSRAVAFAGVAPGSRLLPIRVANGEDSVTPAGLADSIRYAVVQHAGVIDLGVTLATDVPAVHEAITFAERHDVVVVAPVGNARAPSKHGDDPLVYPAAYAGVVGVGAVTRSGSTTNESQHGADVDLVAPGGDVLAPTVNHGYAYWDGTSFAAAYVAGTAALVRAAYPTFDAQQVVATMLSTADPVSGQLETASGHGVVDPYRAVTGHRLPAQHTSPVRRRPVSAQPASQPDHVASIIGIAAGVVLIGLGLLLLLRRRRQDDASEVG